MSAQSDIDRLKFPNGLSVRQAKADAKKLRDAKGIKLHEALQEIAALNGIDLPWEQAIEKLKSTGEQQPSSTPTIVNTSKGLNQYLIDSIVPKVLDRTKATPVITLRLRNVIPFEIEWLYSLPFVTELITEIELRGRKYGVRFEVLREDIGYPEIILYLNFTGCKQSQIDKAMQLPFLNEAISSIADAGGKIKTRFGLSARQHDKTGRITHYATQSLEDMINPNSLESIEKIASIIGQSVVRLNWNESEVSARGNNKSLQDTSFDFAGARRTKHGYDIHFLKDGKDYLVKPIKSVDFKSFCFISRFILITESEQCILLPSAKHLGTLQRYSLLRMVSGAQELTDFGIEMIKACREIYKGLAAGKSLSVYISHHTEILSAIRNGLPIEKQHLAKNYKFTETNEAGELEDFLELINGRTQKGIQPKCSRCGKFKPVDHLNGYDPLAEDDDVYNNAYCRNLAECDSDFAREQLRSLNKALKNTQN